MPNVFIDTAEIQVRSGGGGNGCCSFRREKFVPLGGPDGGDGGKGGDIIIEVNPQLHTLMDLRYRRHYKAGRGVHGRGKKQYGKTGEDCIITVPPGTEVYEGETLLADLVAPGDRVVVARGGTGGRGNAHFANPSNQAPLYHEKGGPFEEKMLTLVLKILADVGLVGLPNAGKSTLLSQISNATPKIADYPFTTLQPNLGDIAGDNFMHFVVADIPGIIEGASEGKGLGLEFLRHIERSRVLLFLVECTDEDPGFTYELLKDEIRHYDAEILKKPRAVAITKCDLRDDAAKVKIKGIERKVPVFHISAFTHTGLEELRTYLCQTLRKLEADEAGHE